MIYFQFKTHSFHACLAKKINYIAVKLFGNFFVYRNLCTSSSLKQHFRVFIFAKLFLFLPFGMFNSFVVLRKSSCLTDRFLVKSGQPFGLESQSSNNIKWQKLASFIHSSYDYCRVYFSFIWNVLQCLRCVVLP